MIDIIKSDPVLVISSLVFGLSTWIVALTIMRMSNPNIHSSDKDGYDYVQMRRSKIRDADGAYRFMERFVLELAPYFRNSVKMDAIRQAIPHMKSAIPWYPEEYLALLHIQGFFVGTGIGIVFWCMFHPVAGVIAGFFVAYLFVEILSKSLVGEANVRRNKIVNLLPFAVDLMALTRGAGATFPESIEVVAEECKETPLGEEFSEVLRQTTHGRTQKQVFDDMAERVGDQDFYELAFVLNKANELGTPVTTALSELSDQMRLKKQQRGEKASGEAQVKIMFPGMIIMIACVIVIVVPFVLQAVYVGL
jgi:pilus assembly protein TadC